MAKQTVGIGAAPNDGTGDTLRTAFDKLNDNCDELYASKQPITAAVDGATVTFDLSTTNKHSVTLGGNRTLALSNGADGQTFTVILKQDGSGSKTVTWWAGILWPAGVAPTLTTTADKYDVFAFIRISSGVYLGFTVGQNL